MTSTASTESTFLGTAGISVAEKWSSSSEVMKLFHTVSRMPMVQTGEHATFEAIAIHDAPNPGLVITEFDVGLLGVPVNQREASVILGRFSKQKDRSFSIKRDVVKFVNAEWERWVREEVVEKRVRRALGLQADAGGPGGGLELVLQGVRGCGVGSTLDLSVVNSLAPESKTPSFASLLITLPSSTLAGADLTVSHNGSKIVFPFSEAPYSMTIAAWYADAQATQTPLTSGHQISILYSLHSKSSVDLGIIPAASMLGTSTAFWAVLHHAFRVWSQELHDGQKINSDEVPVKLAHVLEMTNVDLEEGFDSDWRIISPVDKERVDYLRDMAAKMDFGTCLAPINYVRGGRSVAKAHDQRTFIRDVVTPQRKHGLGEDREDMTWIGCPGKDGQRVSNIRYCNLCKPQPYVPLELRDIIHVALWKWRDGVFDKQYGGDMSFLTNNVVISDDTLGKVHSHLGWLKTKEDIARVLSWDRGQRERHQDGLWEVITRVRNDYSPNDGIIEDGNELVEEDESDYVASLELNIGIPEIDVHKGKRDYCRKYQFRRYGRKLQNVLHPDPELEWHIYSKYSGGVVPMDVFEKWVDGADAPSEKQPKLLCTKAAVIIYPLFPLQPPDTVVEEVPLHK
ncbi:hypothetical protein RUND412_010780 [Rhizina undulata]